MDGSTWIALAEQFISAINGGTVPSIESSWTYICKSKGQEMFEKLKQEFEESLANELTFPANEQDMQQCFDYLVEKFKSDLAKEFTSEVDLALSLDSQISEYANSRLEEL